MANNKDGSLEDAAPTTPGRVSEIKPRDIAFRDNGIPKGDSTVVVEPKAKPHGIDERTACIGTIPIDGKMAQSPGPSVGPARGASPRG